MTKGRKEKRLHNRPHVAALVDYIAKGNPYGVRKLAYTYGYPNFSTLEGSIRFLHQFLKKEGEKGLDDLMMQHPDKEVLLEIYFSKNPQRIQFNSFTGNAKEDPLQELTQDQKALMDTLGILLVQRKENVIHLLTKYKEPVTNENDLKEISDKLIKLIESNNENFYLDLSAEIFALHKGDEKDFVPFVGAIASGIGKIAGSLLGKNDQKAEQNAQKNSNAAAITMAALNYKMNNKQQQNNIPKPKDNTQLWIALGVGSSVLILFVVLILFMTKNQKLI